MILQVYLPGGLDIHDISEEWLEAEGFSKAAVGKRCGAHRCLALWNGGYQEGVLVHRGKNGLLCAYLPAITEAEYRKEQAIIQQMESLAYLSGDSQVQLIRGIKNGRWRLGDLLTMLSEEMKK